MVQVPLEELEEEEGEQKQKREQRREREWEWEWAREQEQELVVLVVTGRSPSQEGRLQRQVEQRQQSVGEALCSSSLLDQAVPRALLPGRWSLGPQESSWSP